MGKTIVLTDANFEQTINSDKPVLVDFWAEWCGPCKMLGPVIEEIAAEQDGRVKVVKVNVDNNPELAARFGVQSIPTLLYFLNGKVIHQAVGVAGKKAILSKLEALATVA